jgi:hypothetical protein
LQTRWIQGLQRWPFTSLQTKATLLVIIIVAGVLALSTFLNVRVSEHALERDLRDHAIMLARQFAAGIGSWEELNNTATLQVDIGQMMEDSPSILGVEVYATVHGVPQLIASSDEESPTSPTPEVLQVAQGDKPVAAQRQGRTGRLWDVAVPVHHDETFQGVVRLRLSLAEADRLAAREGR